MPAGVALRLPDSGGSVPFRTIAVADSASLEGTAAVDRELAQILPPVLAGLTLLLLGLALARVGLAVWGRQRSAAATGVLPEQPVFPRPLHHQRLRDPAYLRAIIDREAPESHRRCA